MKILYINHNWKGEGTFFRAFNFAKHLAKKGHSMTLLTVSPDLKFSSRSYTSEKVKIIETPQILDISRGGWGPLDILHKLIHVLKNRYDIIHGFDHKPNVSWPSLLGRASHKGTIFVSDWADWWMKGGISKGARPNPELFIETFLEEGIRRKADGLTVTSQTLKKRALSIKVRKDRIFYIPSGCDIDRIRPLPETKVKKIKRKYKIPANRKILQFIGFGQGDLGIMIDGFHELRKNRVDAVFMIVGPLQKHLEKKVKNSPYAEDIIITGRVDYKKVTELAPVSDISLMPLGDNLANRGRGPIKAGDYMAAGRPVLANDIGDIGYWIKKYRIGITAKHNAKDIAAKMEMLIKNKRLRKKLARNSYNTAVKVLSWKKVSGDMEKAYNKIIKLKSKL